VSAKPQTIDEYLAPLSAEKRAALEKLRKAIKSAAPGAEECISYQIPGFGLDGRLLVSFGAAANHCAFYPGARPVKAHSGERRPCLGFWWRGPLALSCSTPSGWNPLTCSSVGP
jgi:uncharacterized protein YdhG (YjbR/CyaY superfamily)